MNATTTTPQQDRTADIVSAELATVKAERDEATGSKKGNLTKQVKKLEAELAALTPKPKKKAKGKFDSPAIVALITTASEPMTAAEVAEAMGIELTGALKTRLNWLATRDQVIALIPGATKKDEPRYGAPTA